MDQPASARADDDLLARLLALPELERPSLSPDGRWVAWSWSGLGPTAEIWIAPTDARAPPRLLARHEDDLHVEDWWPDGASLLLSGTRDGAERVRLYRQHLSGRAPELLTEPDPTFYITGGRVHPDGGSLVYAANLDVERNRPIEPGWIYRHDLQSGRRQVLARPARAHHGAPLPSPDGRHVLYARNDKHPAGRQLWLVGMDGGDDREIVDAGREAKLWARWSPDGGAILALAEDAQASRVGFYDLAGSQLHWLIADPARWIEQISWPLRSAEAVLIETREARSHASLFDPLRGAERPFPAVEGTAWPLGPTPDGTGWIARHCGARLPARLVRIGPEGEPVDLTPLPASRAIEPERLAEPEDFRWRSVDGLEIQGWLYRARGAAKGTIVWIHGGPTWHVEAQLEPEIQFLVAAGFNLLAPNYRGSTGFGPAFREAIKMGGWGGLEQEDIRSGIAALVEQGVARARHVGVTGVSYGGYSSWWAITHFPPELVAAAAPVCGMTDLAIDYETTRPDLRIYSEEMMGGSPAQAPARYRERSPLHFVQNIRGRLLIVQGLKDPNVTPENLEAVRRALDAAEIAYETLTFADEGHGIAKPANRALLYRRLASFFAEALGG